MQTQTKKFKKNAYLIAVSLIIVLGSCLRLFFIAHNWPQTNSDEGTLGLMALHIALRGEHPIFYYGQSYLGSLEAHLAAPFVLFFGPSLFSVRLLLVILYALFMMLLYALTSKLYSRRLALLTVLLLGFGSHDMLLQQLRAFGRYPDILVLSTSLLLLAAHLALTTQTALPTIRRNLLFLLEGTFCGLALWTDELTVPFVGMTLLLLLVFCRHELRGWSLFILLTSILMSISPMLYYNFTMPIEHNTLNQILNVNIMTTNTTAVHHLSGWRHIVGSLLFALPAITGFNPMCSPENLPFFGSITANTLSCAVTQGLWTLGYLALWGSATAIALSSVYRLWPRHTTLARTDLQIYRILVIESVRLSLLLCAGAILLAYTLSASPATDPAPTERYLLSMCVALPAVLWPLWCGIDTLMLPKHKSERMLFLGRLGTLLSILAMLITGTVRIFADIPNAEVTFHRQESLIAYLLSHNETRIYSEYWTCNRLIFVSDEHIVCSTLNSNLGPGQNRYPAYMKTVKEASSPAYVFPLNSSQAQNFAKTMYEPHKSLYQYATVAGYAIYSTR